MIGKAWNLGETSSMDFITDWLPLALLVIGFLEEQMKPGLDQIRSKCKRARNSELQRTEVTKKISIIGIGGDTMQRHATITTPTIRFWWPRAVALLLVVAAILSPHHSAATMPRLVSQWAGKKVWDAAYSPDGRYLLTGDDSDVATLWDLETAKILQRFIGHTGEVNSLAYFPDGSRVATGGDSTVRIWDVETGRELRRLEAEAVPGERGSAPSVEAIALSSNGRQILVGRWDYSASLWDVATAHPIRTFPVEGPVLSVAISTRSGRAVTGEIGKAELWELATGRKVATLSGHEGRVYATAFSPDGQNVLTAAADGTVHLWAAVDGRELRRFTGHPGQKVAVAFDPRQSRILTAGSNTVRLWDLRTGDEVRQFRWNGQWANAVAFSPDGSEILVAGYPGNGRWDAKTGAKLSSLTGTSSFVWDVAFSHDGRQIATKTGSGIILWSLTEGGVIRFTEQDFLRGIHREAVPFSRNGESGFPDKTSVISPDGRLGATVDGAAVILRDQASGRELRRLSGPSQRVYTVAFSPDGRVLSAGGRQPGATSVFLWLMPSGSLLRTLEHPSDVFSVAFSPDGRVLATACYDGKLRLWNVNTGRLLKDIAFEGSGDYHAAPNDVAFSPNGSRIVAGGFGAEPRIYDVASGRALGALGGGSGRVQGVAFSPDGFFVALTRDEEGAALYDAQDFQLLARLIPFAGNDWAVVDPAGLYDAPHGGDIEGLHWVVNLEPIALDQLKQRYYEPGLLAKKLGFNKEPLRNVESFKYVALYPSIELRKPTVENPTLEIKLTNRGGGIGKVIVSINGKEITADARGTNPSPDAQQLRLQVPLRRHPYLIPGEENVIEVRALNAEGYLSSRGVTVAFQPPGEVFLEKPTLWAIIAGVSDYTGEEIDLRYAVKDAEAVATALRLGAKRLFGTEKVQIALLGTGTKVAPTKANIGQAFKKVQKAMPWDILVVYLAGHGVALGDTYYYLTQEARSTDLTDPAIRAQAAISSEELVDWVKQSPALKQVLVLDTCAAGTAARKLAESRNISSDQIRAIERLKDRTGFHVLMGSAADAISYEATQYEQGLLTYALLQGMRGAALRNGEYVDVSKLFQHAADTVPDLATHIGGIQRPLIAAPKGTSFDIGQLKAEDRQQIPQAQSKPMLLPPVLLNADLLHDDLKLSEKLRKQLREASYFALRGASHRLPVVYVDADQLTGAIRLSGTYRVQENNVRVSLVLVKEGTRLTEFQVQSPQTDLEALTKNIVEAVFQAVARLQ